MNLQASWTGSPSGPLLEAAVSVSYRGRGRVLDGLSLRIERGEIFGLAGQSGCGKSTFSMAILRLLDRRVAELQGSILFDGVDLLRLPERAMRQLRGEKIALVPQSPLAALSPRLSLGAHFRETWHAHKPGCGGWKETAQEFLAAVSLPTTEDFLRKRPHELSVGMAQRLLIALAVLHRPKLLIADEATSALDLITQAEILRLFRKLNQKYKVSVLFITHDLLAAAALCHRMGVLCEGRLVEYGTTAEVFCRPRHPYTRQLLAALPRAAFAGETGSPLAPLAEVLAEAGAPFASP